MSRHKTSTGVLVRLQGREYQGYCNTCPWESGRVRINLGKAARDGRRHHGKAHAEAAA